MQPRDHTINIIECRQICFSYGSQSVLHNVDLTVHRGDYLGIIGPNGGGKTTLVKIILGLLKSPCGTVKLFGQDIHDFHDWEKIGYVPQTATHFDPNFPATVEEVAVMGRYAQRGLLRRISADDRAKVQQALQKVNMENYSKRLIGDLSSGQQQRVFIARALASEPEVVVLDEPTTGVDEATQKEFYALLRQLNRDHDLTLMLVSHDKTIVEQEASEIAWVNQTLTYTPHTRHA
jgi:zinc transport system ATP-binding protein